MKIMLIQPPMTLLKNEIKSLIFPLGLAYIAAALEKSGFNVEVLDCIALGHDKISKSKDKIHFGLSWSEISKRIKESKPDLVGISALFSSQSKNSHKVAELVKKIEKNTRVVLGGAHPSSVPIDVLSDKNVDYVIIGEGEETMVKLASSISSSDDIKNIEGIAFREGKRIKINPKKEYINNLNSLPFPARHLFPMDIYLNSNMGHGSDLMRKPLTSMITSRGCPFQCVYCSVHTVWGRRYRVRSPKNVVDEIELLVKKYGVREIHFEDDNLTLDRDRIIKICQEIVKRKLDIKWTTPNGVAIWTLDKEVLGWMKRSGCYKLCFGIESADPETQRFIRKIVDLKKAKEIIRDANKIGIWTHGFFIIGFPFEKKESIENTIQFAIKSGVDFASFFLATPYPKTDLYGIMHQKRMIGNISWEDLRVSKASIRTKYFSRDELIKMQRDAFKKFVLSRAFRVFDFKSMFYRIRKIRSIEDIRFLMRFVKRAFQVI